MISTGWVRPGTVSFSAGVAAMPESGVKPAARQQAASQVLRMIIGFPQANFDPRLFLFGTGLKTATMDRLDPVSRQADACFMQGFRRALVHIALAALILRAFLPAGWMPNPKGPAQSAFVICTMDGPVIGTDGKAQ